MDKIKVVPFKPQVAPVAEPNEMTIARIEEMLEMAKSGELVALVAVLTFNDGSVVDTYAFDPVENDDAIIGRLTRLANDFSFEANVNDPTSLTSHSFSEED